MHEHSSLILHLISASSQDHWTRCQATKSSAHIKMNVHVTYVTWQFHNKTLVIIFIHKKNWWNNKEKKCNSVFGRTGARVNHGREKDWLRTCHHNMKVTDTSCLFDIEIKTYLDTTEKSYWKKLLVLEFLWLKHVKSTKHDCNGL